MLCWHSLYFMYFLCVCFSAEKTMELFMLMCKPHKTEKWPKHDFLQDWTNSQIPKPAENSKLSSKLFGFWNKSGGGGNGNENAHIHSPHPLRKSRIHSKGSSLAMTTSKLESVSSASNMGHPTRSPFQLNGMCRDQTLDQPWMISTSHLQNHHQRNQIQG